MYIMYTDYKEEIKLMITLAAKDARQGFGELLDSAQREPVTIEKKGRPVAVLMSVIEFQRLEALEDMMWEMQAKKAEQEGFLGTDAGEKLMQEILHAKD